MREPPPPQNTQNAIVSELKQIKTQLTKNQEQQPNSSYKELLNKLNKIQSDLDILNDRTEKMYKTDKQWLELIVGGAGIAYMGTAVLLAAIFSFAYKFL